MIKLSYQFDRLRALLEKKHNSGCVFMGYEKFWSPRVVSYPFLSHIFLLGCVSQPLWTKPPGLPWRFHLGVSIFGLYKGSSCLLYVVEVEKKTKSPSWPWTYLLQPWAKLNPFSKLHQLFCLIIRKLAYILSFLLNRNVEKYLLYNKDYEFLLYYHH